MKNFVIYTDSSCDLNNGILNTLDIKVLGLTCNLNGVDTIEENKSDIDYSEFYKKLRDDNAMPTTSQVNSFRFKEAFESEIKKGNNVLYIAFSSALSGTCHASFVAREELLETYPDAKIEIIDTKAASTGIGLLVLEAQKLKEEGKSLDEIKSYIIDLIPNVMHVLAVSNLDHLKRGGRISSASAFVGGLLNVKPLLYVDIDGKLQNFAKVKGTKKLLKSLVTYVDDNILDATSQVIYLSHAGCPDVAIQLADMIKEVVPVKDIIINHIGMVIGSHTGPDALAIIFEANGRMPK